MKNRDSGNSHKLNKKMLELLKTQDQLKMPERKYRTIIEYMGEGYYEVDLKGNYVYVNAKFCQIIDYSKKELIGANFRSFFEKKTCEEIYKRFNKVFKTGTPLPPSTEVKVVSNKKKILYFEGLVDLLYDSKGNKIGFFGFVRDVTDRVETERKLKESEKRYKKAYSRAEFYQDILAHDINNILHSANLSLELMEISLSDNGMLFEELQEFISILKRQIESGSSLISKVRHLSKIERQELLKNPVDLEELITTSIDNIMKLYHNQNITINYDSLEESLIVEAGDLIGIAFENLMRNGIEHNKNTHKILTIDVSREQKDNHSEILINFIDNGIGILDDLKSLIFKRGFKNNGGKGIGLTLVQKIIDSYGGSIEVKNRIPADYSKGSIFIVHLLEHRE